MAVTLHLLAHASAVGEPVALIDVADALEPEDLSPDERARLLWVRPVDLHAALRCADLILDGGGFALVALYLVGGAPSKVLARGVPASAWARLAQRAGRANAALLVVTDGDPRFRPGAFAAVGLAVQRRRALLDGAAAPCSTACEAAHRSWCVRCAAERPPPLGRASRESAGSPATP